MNRIILDGSTIKSREQLHGFLAEKLHFPEWYGKNLDALYDCLTEISEETELTLTNHAALETALGAYGIVFQKVLTQAAEENPLFRVGE
jgi:ribonuclease inhibitor